MSDMRAMSALYTEGMQWRPVVAIDPSIRALGYSVLDGAGIIRAAGFVRQTTSASTDYHLRGFEMARNTSSFITAAVEAAGGLPAGIDVILEAPTNWFTEKAMGSKDSEDIQKVYYEVGALIGILTTMPWIASLWCVAPGQWKGSTPKPVMVARALKFAQQQQVFLPDSTPHDTCEAVLLARYAMKLQIAEGYQEPLVSVYKHNHLPEVTFEHMDFVDGSEDTLS